MSLTSSDNVSNNNSNNTNNINNDNNNNINIAKDWIIRNSTGLELKKISKSPFGDYRRKSGRQMQKCSRQIVQEQKLKLEPHLISIVFRLPVDCFYGCETHRIT